MRRPRQFRCQHQSLSQHQLRHLRLHLRHRLPRHRASRSRPKVRQSVPTSLELRALVINGYLEGAGAAMLPQVDRRGNIMTMLRSAAGSLALAAVGLALVAVPAQARPQRMPRPAMPQARMAVRHMSVRPAVQTETPEQARARLNAEQAAAAKTQNDKNAANKAAYEAAVAARDAEIAANKAAEDAAHAKWLADTVPCKDDPTTRCAKPAAQ